MSNQSHSLQVIITKRYEVVIERAFPKAAIVSINSPPNPSGQQRDIRPITTILHIN